MFKGRKIIVLSLIAVLSLILFILPASAETVAPVKVLELSGYSLEDNLYYSGGAPGETVASVLKGLTIADKYKVYDGNAEVTDLENTEIKTGMTIKNISDSTECTIVLKADLNGDGLVSSADYNIVKRSFKDEYKLTDEKLNAADFNSDRRVTSADYILIKRVFAGADLYAHKSEIATKIDFDYLNYLDITQYFTSAENCSVTYIVDSQEGGLLKLTTSGVSAKGTVTPMVSMRYRSLATAIGHTAADIKDNPYLVLKVKTEGDLWNRTFSARGGTAVNATKLNDPASAYMPDNGQWNYIMLDFSFSTKANIFNLNFVSMAGKNGETVYISEMYLLSDKEAALTMCKRDNTYPVDDRTAEDYNLKIMSFNIQTENSSAAKLEIRADLFRKKINELQPDSIGMQEVTPKWQKWVAGTVFNQSYEGVRPETSDGTANMIFYRKDKFDLVDTGVFWLSDTPDVPDSYLNGSEYIRLCTWVRLKDKVTGTEYVHVNTHLDTSSRDIRTAQARIILKFVIDNFGDLPVVFTGDFNQKRTSSSGNEYEIYKNIIGKTSFDGYTSPFSDSRFDALITEPADTIATMTKHYEEGGDPTTSPIDYVFYTSEYMTALKYDSILYKVDGNYVSDHLPLYTEFKLK